MIQLYDNWYQLNDNGQWAKPVQYDTRGLRLLLLGGKARLLPDRDTLVLVSCISGYKLKLSDHPHHVQNDIIDTITPVIIEL